MSCWSHRGCDDEMRGRCPHAIDPEEKCPSGCLYAMCDKPTHQMTSDPALIFSPDVDRRAAAKEICTTCAHFLRHGPRV